MKTFEHGGNVYGEINPAAGFGQWLDFSANINPLGLPDSIRKSIVENIDGIIHYPDPSGKKLKQAIADYFGVSMENIILGNGAVELMYVFMHSFQPKSVLLPVPSFNEYERSSISAGVEVKYLYIREEDDFQLDVNRLLAELENTDVIILGNPNNPTGELIPRETVEKIVQKAAENNTYVIMDESFIEFRQDRDLYTVADLVKKYDNLLVLQSMTKFYAIPGLRLGFGIVPPSMVQAMDMGKDPWNVNLLAQEAGVVGLSDVNYQEKTRQLVADNMAELAENLSHIAGIKVYQPTVNFIMLNISDTGLSSGELTGKMRSKGVLIRDCSNYPGLDERFVRVAVKNRSENDRLVNLLREITDNREV